MKKLLVLTIAVLSFTLSNAQWTVTEYTDEFGENTGEQFKYQQVVGTFSNSATTNSKCGFILKESMGEDKPTLSVTIYPYNGSSKERWSENSNQILKLKTPSGKVVSLKTFAWKKGVLYFSKENYNNLKDALSEKGEYMAVCYIKGSYSDQNYKFKFSM